MTLPTLLLSHEARRLGTDRELRRRAELGSLVRVHPGIYVTADGWRGLDNDERYLLRVQAAAYNLAPDAQFSHDSAAALWRLPLLGRWPTRVHQLTERTAGGTSCVNIARHGLGLDQLPSRIDGVTVTSLARTLVDIAGSRNFARGVVTVDAGLRRPERGEFRHSMEMSSPTKEELSRSLAGLLPYPCTARIKKVIDFSTDLSGSVAESFGRVQFHALGIPAPELQVQFFDEVGFIGLVDYYWRDLDLIGEFDGRVKYGPNRKYRRDVPAEQVLWDEKEREDRLRRVSNGFMRLDWKKITDRRSLKEYLGSFGLHPVRGPR